MKKLLALILALILSFGCLGALAQEGEMIKIKTGMLAQLGVAQGVFNSLSNEHLLLHQANKNITTEATYYDSLSALQLALYAGDVDGLVINELVARYMVARDENLEIVTTSDGSQALGESIRHAYGMMVREQDTQLHAQLNGAIQTLKEEGVIDQLVETYLLSFLDDTSQPVPVELPAFEGAPTIRVAVTGDLPPMDYVAVDGTPAGFNVALLSEIAKLLQVNFELMQVESSARSVAVATQRADVAFWTESDSCPIHPEYGSGFDLPAGMAETDYYLTSTPMMVVLAR